MIEIKSKESFLNNLYNELIKCSFFHLLDLYLIDDFIILKVHLHTLIFYFRENFRNIFRISILNLFLFFEVTILNSS